MTSHPRPSPRTAVSLLAAAALLVALVGCTPQDSVAAGYDSGVQTYESGDFRVEQIPVAERGDPVVFDGVTEYDEPASSDDFAGRVYVVNFWYAACGPCIVEAPMLEEVWQKYQQQDVGFLGINIYDQPASARAFAADNEVTYPSVIDANDGQVKLAFAAATPIQATPTTLVMDRQGRVAARIIGQLQSASILSTLIDDVLAEVH
ncbi:TlpA disulfide reductase family protein [Microbacterium sp. NPDC096154]|uniref:TlpA family protein disulfide reductase n=1 Tax=Microbacterium sp. NPDC096154 TaxID=3155549 RepID=UPI0033330913